MDSVAVSFSIEGLDGTARTFTSAVLERLRTDILSTKLVPGQKLHIAGLAKQFAVSLAAVREALSRLVADGLVQASDQRGFRVSPESLGRSRRRHPEPHRYREPRAAPFDRAWRRWHGWRRWNRRLSRSAPFPTAIPTIRQSHNEVWIARHRVFHRALVNACGSQWLLGFRDVLHEQSERYRRLSMRRETGTIRTSRPNTPRSCDAVLRRDADAAVTALAQHFMTTLRLVELAAPENFGDQRHQLNRSQAKDSGKTQQKTQRERHQ